MKKMYIRRMQILESLPEGCTINAFSRMYDYTYAASYTIMHNFAKHELIELRQHRRDNKKWHMYITQKGLDEIQNFKKIYKGERIIHKNYIMIYK